MNLLMSPLTAAIEARDEWHPIVLVPKDGTLVRLKSEHHAPREAFYWHKRHKRWETLLLTVMGSRVGWWGEEDEAPTHWQAVS